jgi:hypothetical protein
MGAPSILSIIRKVAVFPRVNPTRRVTWLERIEREIDWTSLFWWFGVWGGLALRGMAWCAELEGLGVYPPLPLWVFWLERIEMETCSWDVKRKPRGGSETGHGRSAQPELLKLQNCLLWNDKARAKDKTYSRMSVWWKTKNWSWEIYKPLRHWVARGTGTPKDKDEINRREVCDCDGWVCDLDVMGAPSILSIIRKAAALARAKPTLLLSCEEKAAWRKWNWSRSVCASWTPEAAKISGQFPDEPVRIKVARIHYVISQTY